ncbi:MAG: hypothetical protein PUB20_06820 [Clostridia bacterium]|nr:hypothetical protein [Clostridia bacterium]
MAEKNASLALDLDLFDNAKSGYVPQPREKKITQMPKLLETKTKSKVQVAVEARESAVAAVKTAVAAVVILFILGSFMCMRSQLFNLKSDLNKANAAYSETQSESVQLQMEFNSIMSKDKVEDYAKSKLGMVKGEDYQVRYYDISGSDGAQLTK